MELMLLRPLWLLALLPWLWQGWRRRRQRPLLAPAMQAYLLPAQGRAIPWLWLATLPVILALAGPALRQQSQTVSSPALDLWLLDLSSSMQAKDLPPDRATRVRLLLQDMLAEAAARQAPHPLGLILFAGDAYLAMPPTRDHQAISLLLPDLRPTIMPLQGSAPERAVALALAQIPPGQQARLLLITDGLSDSQMARIAALWPCLGTLFCPQSPSPRLDILLANAGESAVLPPPPAEGWRLGSALGQTLPAPDGAAMADLAASTGGRLQWLQAGLPSFAPLPMSQTQAGAQSLDLGPWLLLPLLPLALLARIGAQWLLLLMVVFIPPPPLQAAPAPWWPAQEVPGWHAFSQGRYQEAARAFQDPVWQGNAWYRAGDHARAVAAYGRADTATAHYNRGNALVWLGDLKGAELAYLAALKREPGHQDALHNLALLRASPPQAAPSAQAPESGEPPEPSAAPDNPRPPAPPVLLLEQRLRKEAERRPLIKVEEPW
ncbi:VWA domain-containing protein [Aeromonas media]|uniref:VWA domain-containing protein n=1 Tax=Aeromonas media TaxID=651 RepID=UPI0024C0FD80|nr:VWA domain-containing protein [Aeromonas media]MDM5077128.1 VWA domain-containing protein [Aeromonas media]